MMAIFYFMNNISSSLLVNLNYLSNVGIIRLRVARFCAYAS